MNKIRLSTVVIQLIFFAVVACTPSLERPSEWPDFEVVTLQITPALNHWLTDIADCADDLADFGIYTQVLPRNNLDLAEADLILRLGARMESDPHVAIMGYEEIVVFVGENTPIDTLSLESLQAIYAGTITHWEKIPEIIDEDIEINQRITTLAYPEGHEVRTLFQQSYLDEQAIESNTQLYTTMDFLKNLLVEDPYAIGFGLLSQAPESSRRLMITDTDTISSQHFVLAITSEEPRGSLRQLLLCLQEVQ